MFWLQRLFQNFFTFLGSSNYSGNRADSIFDGLLLLLLFQVAAFPAPSLLSMKESM